MIMSVAAGSAMAPDFCGGGPTRPRGSAPLSRSRRQLRRRRKSAGTAVFADCHISEDRLGHLADLAGGQVTPPRLDADGHRCAARSYELTVAAHLVANEHR